MAQVVMAWPPEMVAVLVLMVTVIVVVPCCCALCWKCNPEWKYNPATWRWRRGRRVDVVDFEQS